ncbi:MAG: hypothetical protein U9R15_10580, partial [Chloroflexota bacterium]|nr:hypothetical protein [Chloroflexota bacterium]
MGKRASGKWVSGQVADPILANFEGKFMHIVYPDRKGFNQALKEADDDSFNFIVVVTAALGPVGTGELKTY